MSFGAGFVAAKKYHAKTIVNPKSKAIGTIKKAYTKFPQLNQIIPALGYSRKQLKELEKTINRIKCDSVVIGTPIDLSKLINIKKPSTRVFYNLEERNTSLLKYVKKLIRKRK